MREAFRCLVTMLMGTCSALRLHPVKKTRPVVSTKVLAAQSDHHCHQEEFPRQSRRDAILGGFLVAAAAQVAPAAAAQLVTTSLKEDQGMVVCVTSHRTSSYEFWRKSALGSVGFDKRGRLNFPSDMKVVRQIFGRSANEDGSETVHSITVFPQESLAKVKKFYDQKGSLWKFGREQGWLVGPFHQNYFISKNFQGPAPGPPSAHFNRGSGFTFIGHTIGVPYGQWESPIFNSKEVLKYNENMGVSNAVAGKVLPGSTDLNGNAIGVLDFFPTYSKAQNLVRNFIDPTWTALKTAHPRELIGDVYLDAAEVTDDFKYYTT